MSRSYRLIPEVANLEIKWICRRSEMKNILSRPELGPLISRTMYGYKSKLWRIYGSGCPVHKTDIKKVGDILTCPACLFEYVDIWCDNRGLDYELVKEHINMFHMCSNPAMWDPKRFDAFSKKFSNIYSVFIYDFCKNPKAMPIIESNTHLINEKALKILFDNEGAINFILDQGFNGVQMVEYGAEHEHFFPYFDYKYCRNILYGEEINAPLMVRLGQNSLMKHLFRENMDRLIEKYPRDYPRLMRKKHLAEIFIEKIVSLHVPARHEFNANPGAIEFLRNNPQYIFPVRLAANPEGIPLLEEHYGDNLILYKTPLNKNPSAIPLLRRKPHLIDDFILENPNIFEEDTPIKV